jgi:hypothetical protein
MILNDDGGFFEKNSFSTISACDLLNIPDFCGSTSSMLSLKLAARSRALPDAVAEIILWGRLFCAYADIPYKTDIIKPNTAVFRILFIINSFFRV